MREVQTPPYRIETTRLVVRCWEPADAVASSEAIRTSLEHLRPTMSWVRDEPIRLDDRVQLLRSFRGKFDAGEDFGYGIFTRDESRVLGGIGLHPRLDNGGLEIGYWIREDALRRGFATEAVAVLTRVAFGVCGVDRVEIRVEPGNQASRAIPQRLGFAEEATLPRRLDPIASGESRRDCVVYAMYHEQFPASAAATDWSISAAYDSARRLCSLD
jgi:RimJ/RimL family protein N-acetyltransferase